MHIIILLLVIVVQNLHIPTNFNILNIPLNSPQVLIRNKKTHLGFYLYVFELASTHTPFKNMCIGIKKIWHSNLKTQYIVCKLIFFLLHISSLT